jgi:hypothetical protein
LMRTLTAAQTLGLVQQTIERLEAQSERAVG